MATDWAITDYQSEDSSQQRKEKHDLKKRKKGMHGLYRVFNRQKQRLKSSRQDCARLWAGCEARYYVKGVLISGVQDAVIERTG